MANEEVGTGYVLIKPKMDDGAVADMEAKGGKAGGGFGTAFQVAAGNLIANAVTSIASAAVEVFSNAFSNYADYEQLVGGVETLFKESADVVQRNASQAFATAGLSANEYMEQVTSFSASLLQGLGGDTEAAAAYADMAIRDMSDNANKMGSDMATITQAYQGFAKQNYTMLDNLKLGYGGTKTEMERLLKDAGEIAGVEFNIDNYNDVIEAIHVMQENMGIAGTTSKEATETISGSISKLQASWQNFLTGIFDENADLGALGEQLLGSVGDVLKNVVPRLFTMVGNVFGNIPNAIIGVFEGIPDILAPTITAVFGEGVGGRINGLIEGACTSIASVIDGATAVIQGMIETAWPVIEDIIKTAMTAINTFSIEVWPSIQTLITDVMAAVSGVIQTAWPVIMNIISTVSNAIKAVVSTVWPIIRDVVTTAMAVIDGAIRSVQPLVDFVAGIFDGVLNAIKNPMESAKNFIKGIIDAIRGLFNFDIQWPHIPLPHFSVSGSPNPLDWLSGGLPSINVEWYAKGGIVDGATLIGAGEAGPEAIVPLSEPNLRPFADAVAERMGAGIVVNEMTVVTPDPEDFMRQLTAFAARTRAQYA